MAGLGGTNISLGRSGPWYLALQVCPVPFGPSRLPTASSLPLPFARPWDPLPLPHALSHWNPLATLVGLHFLPPCLNPSTPYFHPRSSLEVLPLAENPASQPIVSTLRLPYQPPPCPAQPKTAHSSLFYPFFLPSVSNIHSFIHSFTHSISQ